MYASFADVAKYMSPQAQHGLGQVGHVRSQAHAHETQVGHSRTQAAIQADVAQKYDGFWRCNLWLCGHWNARTEQQCSSIALYATCENRGVFYNLCISATH